MDNDDIFLFLANLMKASREGCLYIEDDRACIADWCSTNSNSLIVKDNSRYYLKRNFVLKNNVHESLTRLMHTKPCLQLSNKHHQNNGLYDKQNEAISMVGKHPLLIVSGGPGSGKSFLARKIFTSILENNNEAKIIAAAPTGRAIHNIKDERVQSYTLHSLLGITEFQDFSVTKKPIFADLVLVDECSMIDLNLWSCLLSSIVEGTHVVLMGDPHQLPPIGTGTIFEEVCKNKDIQHIHLDRSMRTDVTKILKLAEHIKDGDSLSSIDLLNDKYSPEVRLLPLTETTPLPETSCILSPFRKGKFGTDQINVEMNKIFNGKRKPVIVTKNDYTLSLMNGDIGFLCKRDGVMEVDFDYGGTTRTYPASVMPPYELAFAISIHKSQGSEFDDVAILLKDGSENKFGRKMLYTAVTRAKKSVSIFGSEETLKLVIKKE